MKVVIIGCGGMGAVHAKALSQMPGVELIGVCDIVNQRATEFALQYNTSGFTSYEEMMDTVNPDVVLITLPTNLHKEYTVKTALRGKHVICEKPIASTLAEADEMILVCKEKGVRLFVGHVLRFFPNYVNMRNKIAAGAIGEIGVVHAKRNGSHPGAIRAWYNDLKISGGVIMDMMIHDIDFMCWVLGDIQTIYAMNRRNEQYDFALVTLTFKNRAIANLESYWGYPGPFTTAAEFAGTKGVIRYDSNQTESLILRKTVRETQASQVLQSVDVPKSPSFHDPYYYELEHFIDCIKRDATSLVTAEDARKAVKIVLAAEESARTGMPVTL